MWIDTGQSKKWRSDSLEARIYAIAEAEAHANDLSEADAASEAMEAVYRVMAWLAGGRQADVIERIKDAYGIETSAAALSGFWSRLKSSWLGERLRRSSRAARDLANLLDREEVEAATWDLLSQQAFELLTSPDPNPSELVALGKLLLSGRQTALDARRVTLLEEKARQAAQAKEQLNEATAAVRKGGLTEETLRRIEEAANLL